MGGRFAGAMYDGDVCTKHISFQKYTVRKKQGGSQVRHPNITRSMPQPPPPTTPNLHVSLPRDCYDAALLVPRASTTSRTTPARLARPFDGSKPFASQS